MENVKIEHHANRIKMTNICPLRDPKEESKGKVGQKNCTK